MNVGSAVVQAYLYLQLTSIRNALTQRIKRLRQPKYLFGAMVGGAYFYFFLFRNAFRPRPGSQVSSLADLALPASSVELVAALLLLLAVVVFAWLVPSGRAALSFTEAECAFLFPAPIARRTLIHLKLLRSQIAIFLTAFLMSLLFRRGVFAGGAAWQHAAGWWLVLSALNLHFIGASFVRDRLLDLGVNPLRRRLLIGGLLLALGVACYAWLRAHVAAPTIDDLDGLPAIVRYAGRVLSTGPLPWVLMPFKLVVAPMLADGRSAFFAALPAALLIIVVHYLWVVRSDVAFEEASIDVARRRAERAASIRAGGSVLGKPLTKPRPVPFRLSPNGFVPVAFLWKGLISLGPMYRLRYWLMACAVVVVGGIWMRDDPAREPLLKACGGAALGIGTWLLLLGPMFIQRSLRKLLEELDILKASPLAGWQIVLGQLSAPIALMTFSLWWLLLVATMAFGSSAAHGLLGAANFAVGAAGIALIAMPLCGLMLCVPFAGLLVFPAWSVAAGSHGGGIEVMGQRVIFFGAYALALMLALLPATLASALVFFLLRLVGSIQVALACAALAAAAMLIVEFWSAIDWLGRRLDRFDLAQEMPR